MYQFDYQASLLKTVKAIRPLEAKKKYVEEQTHNIAALQDKLKAAEAKGDSIAKELKKNIALLKKKTKILGAKNRLAHDGNLGKRKRT